MGKGGGGGYTPHETPDNLKSTQLLSVIDALSEGPIQGPVNGLQSILINNTPVMDATGSSNVNGVNVVYRVGEQPQSPLERFEASGAETVLGVEVRHDNPITRTLVSEFIDRLRITLGVQSLVETTNKGDRNPARVELQIQLQRNGGWVTEKTVIIDAKTTTQFLMSVVIDDLPARPFGLRVVRLTPDSNSDQLQNKTLWSSYTELLDIQQSYPNTAVVGIQVDAAQFGSQQVTRNYHVRGRIVQVPSNYDPTTRTYTGIWDGAFKPAYSDNPAWCTLDMLTHPRYGLGAGIGISDVDKWALYAIAQYCDQLVPDGFGGMEPRMTCHAYLATQRKAYDVLADFCSVMRCMPVWNGQRLTFVQDRPADTVWPYTNSNVVNGEFKYGFSALKDRHNAVEVRYIDPSNGWQTSTELVEDHEAITRYGRNLLKMDAFGCTSRGQAHRMGLWVIKTELLETQTVDFALGAEGLRHTPGDIVEIVDNDYAGAQIGGRLLSVDRVTRTLTLDREIELPAHGSAMLTVIGADGIPQRIEVQSRPSPDQVVVNVVPEGMAAYGIWGLTLPRLRRRLFRCVQIREGDNGTYAVTGVQHVPEKEAVVDNGASFDTQSASHHSVIPPAVQHLGVDIQAVSGQYQAKADWDTPRVVNGVRFALRLTVDASDSTRLVTTTTTTETEYIFGPLALGDYTLTVRAVSREGLQGDPTSVRFSVVAPAAPVNIELTPGYFQITVTPHQPSYHADTQYEFWFSATRIVDASQITSVAQYLGTGMYWVVANVNIKPGKDYFFYVRSVNGVGKSAFVEAVGQPSHDAAGYLEFFKGEIGASHLSKALMDKVDIGQDNASKITQFAQEWKDTRGKWNSLWGVKIEQTANGEHYVTGLGLSLENTPAGRASQFLVSADRIAFINPANGNKTPMFVGQGDQIYMNEVFLKYLNAATINASTITSRGNPPTFSLSEDGHLTARNADISGNINATSGTFSRVVIDDTCDIKYLRADAIEGDIVITRALNDDLLDQTLTFSPSKFQRTVMVQGILLYAFGGQQRASGGGGGNYQDVTNTIHTYITVNGVSVTKSASATGSSGRNTVTVGHSFVVPAGQTITVRVVKEGPSFSSGGERQKVDLTGASVSIFR